MSAFSCRKHSRSGLRGVLAGLVLTAVCHAPASAQGASGANSGALHFTGGLDVPSVYVFRGFVQESEPKLTLFPYGDLGIALVDSAGGTLKTLSLNVGVWNSLQTGSSGSDGPSGHLHYEEDFYSSVT